MMRSHTRTIENGSPGQSSSGTAAKDTREQLLDAATVLFAEQGIAATTLAQIAMRVGVTSAMIHYYFKTRDQLLDMIVEERIKGFIAFVWDPIAESGDDPFALVQGLVSRIIRASELMPWLPPLWIREISNEGGELREKIFQHLPFDKFNEFGECIAAAQQRGAVNAGVDPRLLYLSIIGLTVFPLATAKIWKRIPTLEGLNTEQLARHAISLLTHGLTNPSLDPVSKSG
jgi:TetR/AcrR family transcriptional regulator